MISRLIDAEEHTLKLGAANRYPIDDRPICRSEPAVADVRCGTDLLQKKSFFIGLPVTANDELRTAGRQTDTAFQPGSKQA